jgi:hypothetical protein
LKKNNSATSACSAVKNGEISVFEHHSRFKPHKKQKTEKICYTKHPLLRYNYKKEGIMEADSEIAIIRNISTLHL